MPTRKKLIEVALPLAVINSEGEREKSIRHGHPSTLHLWWARRPLAICRAVIFAALVDDPSARPDEFPTETARTTERKRLFGIIEDLVRWEATTNESVLETARQEIRNSTGNAPPPILDPFAGGGSIPLEAQRLGLEAHAADLNPVAVLINKAMIEIPPHFAGRCSVAPNTQKNKPTLPTTINSQGTQGLAADIHYYGQWIEEKATQRIGHLYPKAHLPKTQGGGKANVIAWIWARTVRSPNPAWNAHVPLVKSFLLCNKPKKPRVWAVPILDHKTKTIHYTIRSGEGDPPEATVSRNGGVCLATGTPMPFSYIREEGRAGRLDTRLMAVVAQGPRGRIYLAPDKEQEKATTRTPPATPRPKQSLSEDKHAFNAQLYGLSTFEDLFSPRQFTALTTFSDLIAEAREQIYQDALAADMPNDQTPLREGGAGAWAYAEAVSVYLAFVLDKCADYWSSICTWNKIGEKISHTFGRQAIPMSWDWAEANPFSHATGSWNNMLDWVWKVVERLPATGQGKAVQADAANTVPVPGSVVVATDPPYYDMIGFADLSDFFYVWLRPNLQKVFPDECSTLLAPKEQELIAAPHRHGGDKEKAKEFFETGLKKVFARLYAAQHTDYPLMVFYAFKQAEQKKGEQETASTGWETMLEGLLSEDFTIEGTWPVRTERKGRMRAHKSNVLASSIVLVCRKRPAQAVAASRKELVRALRAKLPEAIRLLQEGNLAPVDLAQAAIGPGMSIFSRYTQVVEADGTPMRVRAALVLINQILGETLTGQESGLDAETRWAVAWFEQCGMKAETFGTAETLSKAKNTSVPGLIEAGILWAQAGKARLLTREEMDPEWDPTTEARPTVWKTVQQLIRALDTGGEEAAAALLRKTGSGKGEAARDLAYRLYAICDHQGWAKEAYSYNSLIPAWPTITRLAAKPEHGTLFHRNGSTNETHHNDLPNTNKTSQQQEHMKQVNENEAQETEKRNTARQALTEPDPSPAGVLTSH